MGMSKFRVFKEQHIIVGQVWVQGFLRVQEQHIVDGQVHVLSFQGFGHLRYRNHVVDQQVQVQGFQDLGTTYCRWVGLSLRFSRFCILGFKNNILQMGKSWFKAFRLQGFRVLRFKNNILQMGKSKFRVFKMYSFRI